MQTPTPPTKPIPPTPPTINGTSSKNTGTDTHNSPAATPSASTSGVTSGTTSSSKLSEKQPQKQATKIPSTEKPASSSSSDTNQTSPVPYLSNYKETSSKTAAAPMTPSTNKPSPSIGLHFILLLILIIAISLFTLHWWKKTAIKKRIVRNYSADTTEDLLHLMNSQVSADSLPKPTSKLIVKPKAKKEQKSNFEIRI